MRHYHPSFIRQCLVLACGLALAGFGVALTTRAGLGTSPISSLPYVVTFLTPLTFGMTTFVVSVFFVLGQVALLRRDFPVAQFGQLGWCCSLGCLSIWGCGSAGCGFRARIGGDWRRWSWGAW